MPSDAVVPAALKTLDASALSAGAFGALSFFGGLISSRNNHGEKKDEM
jgi:hypothetical protein